MENFLYINWNVDPVIFQTGGVRIAYYGILFVSGLMLCTNLFLNICKNNGIQESISNHLMLYAFLGIIIGARLGHCIFYDPAYYFTHPFEMFFPFQIVNEEIIFTGFRGLASHGGVIGLIIAVVLYSKKYKQSKIRIFDYLAIVAPLGACFIRLGNLMNSEIIGEPTNLPWGFVFERIDLIPRHPAQLYEAVMYLIIFFVMFYLYKKDKANKPGFLFGLVLMQIFAFRFIVEFIKEKQSDFEFNMYLNMGQILSIPLILIGAYFAFFFKDEQIICN